MKNKKKLFSSLHMVVICVVLLAGLTWAWFSEKIVVPTGTITAATYSAEVSVSGGDEGFVVQNGTTFTVENGKVYDIKIHAKGTAPEGFSIISAEDKIWHTIPMAPGNDMVIRAQFPGTGTREVSIEPSWGSYRDSLNAGIAVSNGDFVISSGDTPVVTNEPAGGEGSSQEVSGNN